MGWKIHDEAIEVVQRRYRYFPQVFGWRGKRYEVEAVERCWIVSRLGWRGRVDRHFFLVRCSVGAFELYQDVRSGLWYLRRAKLTGAQSGPVRQVAPAWR
jgi:hypothetical protein